VVRDHELDDQQQDLAGKLNSKKAAWQGSLGLISRPVIHDTACFNSKTRDKSGMNRLKNGCRYGDLSLFLAGGRLQARNRCHPCPSGWRKGFRNAIPTRDVRSSTVTGGGR